MRTEQRVVVVQFLMVLSALVILLEIDRILVHGWQFWSSVWLLYGGLCFAGLAAYAYYSLHVDQWLRR